MAYHGTFAFLAAGVTAAGIGANLDAPRSFMTRQDYSEAHKAIDAGTRLALASCRSLEGLEKTVCRAAAHGDDRVRRAELEARYRGTVEAESQVLAARSRAALEIERTRSAYLKL